MSDVWDEGAIPSGSTLKEEKVIPILMPNEEIGAL
jgi:hypothetical protein